MRKHDYLRKILNNIESEADIFFIELPIEFRAKGEKCTPHCLPLLDSHFNIVGICVKHEYKLEYFILRRCGNYRIRKDLL